MATDTATTLLGQLRAARPGTDWRRDRPHPELPEWQTKFSAALANKSLSPAEVIEAEAHLSRLALDPLPTLRGFLALCEQVPGSAAAAYRLIQELVSHWGEAMATLRTRSGPDATKTCQQEAIGFLRDFAKRHPQAEQAQLALLTLIRVANGATAALEHIIATRQPLPALVTEYFNILIDQILRSPDRDNLRRAFSEPLPFRAPISFEMLRFRFHRAVVVEGLIWNKNFNASFRETGLSLDLEKLPEQDAAAELQKILGLLAFLSKDDQAQAFMSLMACPAIWRSPAAEASRQRLLDEAMHLLPTVSDRNVMTSLMARLIDYAPQSIIYWENDAWRRRLHDLARSLSSYFRAVHRHYFNGTTAFPLPDLDEVAKEYKLASIAEPTASRFTSYLDPRVLRPEASEMTLNAAGFVCDAKPERECQLVVATSADENYFRRYAAGYARSLKTIGAGERLHFHIIGIPSNISQEIEEIRKILPNSTITISSEPVLANRSFYYASARFLRMKDLLSRFQSDILFTDIDLSWHAKPEAWLSAVDEHDVGLRIFDRVRHYVMHKSGEAILRFPRTKLWECTSASSVFLRFNKEGCRFAEMLASVATTHLRPFLEKPGTHWFIDQNILSAVYAYVLRHHPDIRIGNLDHVGTPYGPFGMIRGTELQQSYGGHWITQPAPFPPLTPEMEQT